MAGVLAEGVTGAVLGAGGALGSAGMVMVVSRSIPPPETLPCVVVLWVAVLCPDICNKQSSRSWVGRLLQRSVRLLFNGSAVFNRFLSAS